jgi:putative heme-binding domain-containing protein
MLWFALLLLAAPQGDTPAAFDGRASFARHCALCHRIGDVGQAFGPELSDAGSRLDRAAIELAIREPSAAIAPGYELLQVDLEDGRSAIGIDGGASGGMRLLRQAGGIVFRYREAEVRRRTMIPKSGMTELAAEVTAAEIAAIVEYVAQQRMPVREPPRREPPPAAPPKRERRTAPGLLLVAAGVATLVIGAFVLRGARRRPAP